MAKASYGIGTVHSALPFTVDTFALNDGDKPRFVTHAHKDHAVDIEKFATTVWCTEKTRLTLLIRFPCLKRTRTTFHSLPKPDPQEPDFREAMEDHGPQQVQQRCGAGCAADVLADHAAELHSTMHSSILLPSQRAGDAKLIVHSIS